MERVLGARKRAHRGISLARGVTHSIIFGRILFKFDGHILQMTTSYTACTHVQACVGERACASIQQIPRGYMSHIMCVWMHVLRARTSISSRICQARDGQWLFVYNVRLNILCQHSSTYSICWIISLCIYLRFIVESITTTHAPFSYFLYIVHESGQGLSTERIESI
jgi:hypothetical protein